MAYVPANPDGQATMANSSPVVIASDQSTLNVNVASGTVSVSEPVSVDDNGGSLTVDGTVTANLAAGTNNIGDVDVLSVPAPLSTTGGGTEAAALRVTIATDSTGVVSIDDNAGSLTVDNAALSVVGGGVEATALRVTIANDSTGVVSIDDNGGSVTVDGTVTIQGDVSIIDQLNLVNSDPVTVAIVDGNGDQIVSFGGGTQYTEDAAAAANPTGTAPILVRQDTPAALVSTDGDNVAQRGTNYGAAYTQIVTSGGAFVDTFGGGTQYTEGDVDATITGTAAMMEVGGNTLQPVQGTVADGLLVNLGANNDVTVTGSVDATNAAFDVVGGGVEAAALRVTIANDSTGVLSVDDNGSTISIDDGAGSITVDGTVSVTGVATEATLASLLTSSQLIDDTIATLGTDTYTEATTKGQIIGAVRRDADTTLVNTTNEVGPLQMDANGRLKVEIFDGGDSHTVSGTVNIDDGGGSISVDDNGLSLTVDAPVGTPVNVQIGDATNTATIRNLVANDALNVAIVDGSGGHITSFGGGTEYTEDVAAATDPVGKATILVRQDTPTTLVTTDGDNVAQRATNYGAAYTQIVTSGGAFVDTFGGGTQYNEGDADASITGTVAMMEVAANTLQPVQGTVADGLLVNLGANNDVTVTGSVTANAGTNLNTSLLALESGGNLAAILADTANIETAVQLIDDTVKTLGTDTYTEATTKGLVIGAVRRDADTTLADTTNEIAPLQVDANGRLKVEVFSGETLPVSLTSTTITGTVAVTQSGTWDEVGINDSGNKITVDWNGVDPPIGGGTEATALKVTIASDSTGVLSVDDNAGSLTVDAPIGTPVNAQIGNGTLAAGVIDETGASAVDALAVGGGTAHDAVDSGNPVKVGGVAVSGSASPTSVAASDRVRFIANQHGIPYGIGGHPNLITREYDFGTAAQTDVNLAAALVAADERVYVTRFEALCDNANTVAVSVRAGFGAASVPTASATGVSGMIASHPGIAAGSGIMSGNGAGILAVGGAGEEPRLTSSAATTGNLHVIISYFLIDETP